MTDVFDKSQRSRIMAKVRSKNTTPEIVVRSLLHRLGFRFRLHRKDLPGKPDIILPKYKTAIFVHGCFWHQHPGCKAAHRPTSNTDYWNRKLDRNMVRDDNNIAHLEYAGWRVVVIWECETRDIEELSRRLSALLRPPSKPSRSGES